MSGFDVEKYRHWLDFIKQNGVNLSDWEKEFIQSIDHQLNTLSKPYLSHKQAEILERIYTERTP